MRQSGIVIIAALGGMLFPAAIFLFFNLGLESSNGWGIPMATDTAFVLGLLALLGNRVPNAAKVFLVGVAIVDDIGAVLVIALFYSQQIDLMYLMLAGLLLLFLLVFNLAGIRKVTPYALVSVLLWIAIMQAGIHGTVAGILAALMVPARSKKHPESFAHETRDLIDEFDRMEKQKEGDILASKERHEIIENFEEKTRLASTPLQRWERALENPVNLLIIPLVAFFNAGIVFDTEMIISGVQSSVTTGVVLGLLVGKLDGITLFSWAAIKLKIGRLPDSIAIRHVIGIAILAGMGFTMSIFIANLGFSTRPDMLAEDKIGVILATFISGMAGILWMYAVAGKSR